MRLLKILEMSAKVLCVFGVLIFAYGYRNQVLSVEYCLYSSMIVAVIFLLLCRTKKSVIYELNKDVFCGIGKRFLYLALLVVGFAGVIHLTTYAAAEETGESVNELEDGTDEGHLRVILYDEYGRKILIKEGESWEIEKDIALSVPIDELQTGEGRIAICYESKSSDARKSYSFDVVKETD